MSLSLPRKILLGMLVLATLAGATRSVVEQARQAMADHEKVRALDGRITLVTAPGNGTQFAFNIPLSHNLSSTLHE